MTNGGERCAGRTTRGEYIVNLPRLLSHSPLTSLHECVCTRVCVCGKWGSNNGTYGWHGHAIFSMHTKDEVSFEQYDLKVSTVSKTTYDDMAYTLHCMTTPDPSPVF